MMFILNSDTAESLQAWHLPGSIDEHHHDSVGKTVEHYSSIFNTTSKFEELNPQPFEAYHQPFWVPAMLLLALILLAWVKLFFWRRMQMIFRGVFARNYANQLIREGNLFRERPGLILFIVYLLVMAMWAYQALALFNIGYNFPPWMMYVMLFAFFLALWFFKVVMVNGLSLLFNTSQHSHHLLTNMFLYNLFLGMVLLAVVCLMSYASLYWFFYISLFIISLTYLIRIIRSAMIGFNMIKFSVFHLILYLCTLEILPLIVLAKILTRNMIL